MGLMTSQRSLWPWTTPVTMRHLSDVAHVEAATADLGKNDEPGNDDHDANISPVHPQHGALLPCS